ncbi:hypothetical protein MHYP_G00185980 [Metynnis hypsauchen]
MCKLTRVNIEEQMEEDKGKDDSRGLGNRFSMSRNGFPIDPWHSTPVKKHTDEVSMARQTARSPQPPSNHISSLSIKQSSKTSACDLEISTIQKQRMELQLLIAELKDRDQELNTMAASHHRQLQAWEQDRQRVLTLEQRCARLEDELQKRNEVIRAISKHLKIVEAREKDIHRELGTAQQQLKELSQRQQHSGQQQHDLEEKNQSLNSTIMTLSSQVGQLQVHEEELSSMLKLKDKDLMEATFQILSLTNRLRESDASLRESQTREGIMLQETEKYKRRFREARHENVKLKDELQEKTIENNSQREELIRLKQENQLLRKELALAGHGESWKDELLELARSKQERTESELLCLRQVCEKQLNDLQLLKLNLESTREALRLYEDQRSFKRRDNFTGAALEHSSHQGTESGESVHQQCQSRSIDIQPISPQGTVESATVISASSAITSGYFTDSQNTLSGPDFSCCKEEKQAERNSTAPPTSNEFDGAMTKLGTVVLHCCDCNDATEDDFSEVADCEGGTEVDLVAVINCDLDTETPVLVVDVSTKDLHRSSPGDVTCLYVECPKPSPQSWNCPAPVEDAALNSIISSTQEEYNSSTSRLQRLLAESQQMVASLERSSGKSLSPTPSPTSHCNSVCSLCVNHNNGNSHNHSQSPRNSQEERVDDSQIQNVQQCLRTKTYITFSSGSLTQHQRTDKMSSKMKSEKTDKSEKKTDKSEKALAAEKEQFVKLQLQSIGKTITTAEAPIKEKYARKILLGTHKEGGAVTFWSHVVSLPLASNAILSWKFCHMVHKLLRDGHPNTVRDSRGHVPSIKQMGTLWGSLHDRYGHIVALYAKFLCIKIDFHCKHKEIPANLETPDEVLDRTIAVDINKVFETTGEVLDYMDAALLLQETVFRQLETNSTSSTTPVGQSRLAPLVLVIQDCSPLYHYLVKLLFKLHSRIPVDALLGHRERFRNQFDNLTQFFEKARGMEFFKTIIQIPDLPDSPPNFLRAASLADHVKPVVVRNQELPDDDDTETQLDFGEAPGYQMFYAYNQYDPPSDVPMQRETEVDSLRKELEAVKPELQMFKAEAQRAVVQLKEQVNMLEAELEEQRTHKQMALVENEHLRMEVEALRTQSAVAASLQASADDAGSRAQTAQIHFSRLKEKHAELVTRHADLMRKNTDMVKQLSSTQQAQEELFKTKEQMAQELEQLRQEKYTKAEAQKAEIVRLKQELQSGKAEIMQVQTALQSKEKSGDQLSSVLVGLQTEKETLLRSMKEQETELANLRQAAQLHQTTLQQERERSQSEMSSLQSQLQDKVCREQEQQLELDKLKRELELKRAEALSAQTALQSKEVSGDQLSSVLVGLQAEKDMLLRSLKEQETELANLRQAAQLHQTTLQQERERNQREMSSLQNQLQQILRREQEQQLEIARLKHELEERRAEAFSAQSALNSKEMAGDEINSVLTGLQAEKEVLLRSVKEQEAELINLRQAAKLHQATLVQERQRTQRETSSLQSQLQAKSSRESMLQQKLQEEQFCLLQCAVVEAEGIILDAVAKVDDPMFVRCVSTPEYLINRAETTLVSIDKMQQNHAGYLRNMDDASGLLRAVTQFSHLAADTIVNGAATAHAVPTDQADRLTDNCRDCATHCLQFLKELKLKPTLQRADPTAIRYVVQRILNQGHDLRHKDADIQKAELVDMVDSEMAATSTAIEEAVLRMDEILSQARRDTSGVKLEVNQSIIGSCSDLMKAIHMLVTAATDLQKDIVESGRGAGSVKDFYAKNSCWTEGLISASKTVGWAATQMVESADKVVTDRGKYEELIVCSHEIAASTAQLVAASKVKADRSNKKLHTLQHASRHVNDMAAVVVTSTKAGQMQIEDKNPMDFSGISLIKLKTEEMESQVRVLELESKLSSERQRLGELRKKHYELSGVPLNQPVERNYDRSGALLKNAFR